MTKAPSMTLEQLDARLQAQSLEMAALRAALDTQFKRIAQMQAELDLLPHARSRRSLLMAGLSHGPSHNGNGRRHR
jgi:multidrug resistance efflux pump